MNNIKLIICTLFFLYSHILCKKEKTSVLQLTDKNLDDELKKHKCILILFYAPWCGHCNSLHPHYNKAAQKLSNLIPSICLASVDATENENLSNKFKIDGYPTIWFRCNEEKWEEYFGGRQEDDIIKWVSNKVAHPKLLKNN